MPAPLVPHPYCGRFAPSPTGPLHAGSLVAALASWLDARAHHGQWLIRIEDIDPPRCQVGADLFILQQLAQVGLHSDAPVQWQSKRHTYYQAALTQLQSAGWAYPCGCTRKDIDAAWQQQAQPHTRHIERPYPGTCRTGLHGKPQRSWRFALQAFAKHTQPYPANSTGSAWDGHTLTWYDRRLGTQHQAPTEVAGDFVLQRADGLWSYQLAVVVDDALQGVTHVVRGEDLTANTPRQLLLQAALGLPQPHYLHTPLVCMADGEKLSKQHGAQAVDLHNPLAALQEAASALHLAHSAATCIPDALADWVAQWQVRFGTPQSPH